MCIRARCYRAGTNGLVVIGLGQVLLAAGG